jgi:uncharacterized protein (TIGR03435 family)
MLAVAGACAGLLILGAPTVAIERQTPPAQPTAQGPQFDVATVKINRSGDLRARHNIIPATGQFTITNISVRELIQDAYGVAPSQLVNVPGWAQSEHVDVIAKASAPAPIAELQRMLQPLLAEYFKLSAHRGTREVDVFGLVPANRDRLGPRLTRNEDSCEGVLGTTSSLARAPDGAENQRGTCGILPGGAGRIIARGLDMPGLAAFIGTVPGRMVVDRTGLSGRFDVDLTYTPQAFSSAALAQRPGATLPPGVDPNGPSIASALQEQLGLKLEPIRAAIEVVVVDHMEPLAQTP